MAAIARTAAGVEGALLIHADGTLVTSSTMMASLGEMKMWLIPPEDGKWVKLDGLHIDADKHPRLAEAFGNGKLPKLEHIWVYAG